MTRTLNIGLPLVSLALLFVGSHWGLAVAPPETYMVDLYRIMFVHVPAAMMALLAFTVCFVASVVYLIRSSGTADAVAESTAEVGVVFTALLLITGSIWGRPTWGVWWAWDPRLTSAAVLFFAFAGYLALRQFVDDPDKRATWSAVVAILISVDIPIVYFSVKWWATLHQQQSSPNTLSPDMTTALRLNIAAFFFIFLWFSRLRYLIALRVQRQESVEPPVLPSAEA